MPKKRNMPLLIKKSQFGGSSASVVVRNEALASLAKRELCFYLGEAGRFAEPNRLIACML